MGLLNQISNFCPFIDNHLHCTCEIIVTLACQIQRHANYTGVLLHGPPGTGKTSLACSCAHDSGVKLFSINGPEIVSEVYGKSEQELHRVFDKAKQAASAMVRFFVLSHFLQMG